MFIKDLIEGKIRVEKSDTLQLVGSLATGCEEGQPGFLHSLPCQNSVPPTPTSAKMRKVRSSSHNQSEQGGAGES